MRAMTTIYTSAILSVMALSAARAQNYVSTGGEFANFKTVDLTTSSIWGTNRSSNPGYFCIVGTAAYISASDTENINGYVKRYVTTANQGGSFPVGDGSQLRQLTMSGTIANGCEAATAWYTGSPDVVSDPTAPNGGTHSTSSVGTGISAVSSAGFWDWQDISGTAAGATITVSIPDMSGFAPAANLRLVGWNGSQWINLGTAGSIGNAAGNDLSGIMQSGITALAVGATSLFSVTPDLTPGTDIDALSFTAGAERDFIVDLFEVAGGDALHSVQPIVIAVSRPSAFDITVPGLTLTSTYQPGTSTTSDVGGGRPNENSNWLFRQTASFIFISSQSGTNIMANSQASLGLHIKRKVGIVNGTAQNISVTIVDGSGGEAETTNNNSVTTATTN